MFERTRVTRQLLYLTSQTWTRGDESDALAAEIAKAFDLDVHVLLAHEMLGMGGQKARFGCEFGAFFSCVDGSTPEELLRRGICAEPVLDTLASEGHN